jgi:membrane dipeptidase
MKKIDLHNDLLHYLANKPHRTPYDEGLACSIPQMIQGEIAIQVLAMFEGPCPNPGHLFRQFQIFSELKNTKEHTAGVIRFYPAIEGAEQLLHDSPLGSTPQQTVRRLVELDAKPVYVSLTWLDENSLGGGDRTTIGLKERGRDLLRVLNDYNIAVDLSHASDELASDIIEFREGNNFTNGILVSHTTFRGLHPTTRNVSDDVARYVSDAGGLIGLSFSRSQMGLHNPLDIEKQLRYAQELSDTVYGAMCLGGDLFHEGDLPLEYRLEGGSFYPELCVAGDYRKLHCLGADVLHDNAWRFLGSVCKQHLHCPMRS